MSRARVRVPAVVTALLLGWAASADDGAVVTVPAPRPVTVRLQTGSGDVEVSRSREPSVVLQVEDDDTGAVRLVARDRDTLEAQFDGQSRLASGSVRLQVPAGSRVDLHTQSGDIRVRDLGGEVVVRSLSGDISVTGAIGADLRTISGDARVQGQGAMRVKTVSGDVELRDTGVKSTVVELESTSGDIRWSGSCGPGCRLGAGTVSGDVELGLDPRSSFAFTMQSHSGELEDDLGLQVTRSGGRRRGADLQGRYGRAEGSIDCRTFSGDVQLRKR